MKRVEIAFTIFRWTIYMLCVAVASYEVLVFGCSLSRIGCFACGFFGILSLTVRKSNAT